MLDRQKAGESQAIARASACGVRFASHYPTRSA